MAIQAEAARVAAEWRAEGQQLPAQGCSSTGSPAHEPETTSSTESGDSGVPDAGQAPLRASGGGDAGSASPGAGPGPRSGVRAAPAPAAVQLRPIRPGVWARDALHGSSTPDSLAATAAWLRDAAPAPVNMRTFPEPGPANQESSGPALGTPPSGCAPAASTAGGITQAWEAGASEGAVGMEQHADNLQGRLRQVLATATVQLPPQKTRRRRKASSGGAQDGAAGARVLAGRARLLVLVPRPDRPFSAGEAGAGSGDGVSRGGDIPLTEEGAAAARARKDASLGVGPPVSEAARRLGLGLGGDLPLLTPADGSPPIIPDAIGLLGCGGFDAADGAPCGRGWEEDEEEPLLGHAWETGRCFTIPMTVMYRISTDLGQVLPAGFPLCMFCKTAPTIASDLLHQALTRGLGPLSAPFAALLRPQDLSSACLHPWTLGLQVSGCTG